MQSIHQNYCQNHFLSLKIRYSIIYSVTEHYLHSIIFSLKTNIHKTNKVTTNFRIFETASLKKLQKSVPFTKSYF